MEKKKLQSLFTDKIIDRNAYPIYEIRNGVIEKLQGLAFQI